MNRKARVYTEVEFTEKQFLYCYCIRAVDFFSNSWYYLVVVLCSVCFTHNISLPGLVPCIFIRLPHMISPPQSRCALHVTVHCSIKITAFLSSVACRRRQGFRVVIGPVNAYLPHGQSGDKGLTRPGHLEFHNLFTHFLNVEIETRPVFAHSPTPPQ